MTISVLGPFMVDGDVASLAPRDRVVLEVLVLRLGEVVSAERLADAMWPDALPPTWIKVVQGSIVRLRKVLGAESIETSAAGYRLTTPPDEVDAHRFERMARRGAELLSLGEYDRAAYVSGEALALWRGPALRELEGWDTGRIEAGRLEELRLDAEEVRLDAALRAGHQREVLAEAQARAAEAPLRERRWSLLALAQYQVGRQGDALRTLRQARQTLVGELGVDPGSELVALEQAILRQDPLLMTAAAPEPSSACPYQGLVPYDIADSEGFFGREREVDACLARLIAVGVLMVVGPSGSGKSSLVRAGVAASLQHGGRRVTVITPGARPMDALAGLPTSGPAPVLVVDQCEEAVTLCDDRAMRSAFFAALAAHADRGLLIVALRADRLGELSTYPGFVRLVESGLHLLSAMSDAELRAAIEGPARQAGLLLEPGLVDLLVRDVEGEPGALPLLSHALHETWQRREGRTLTVEGYQDTGGIRGAVAQSAEDVYDRVPAEQRPLLRDLLLRLVAPTPDGEPVRSRVPRRTVATDAEHEGLVELLVRARLVTSDDETVELAHESLARAWPRLRIWLDDDVEGQRILRHLALTADTWDTMARPDSELYRGVRLAQALDWQNRANPDLTPAERAFLDTSAEWERDEAATTEQRMRQQARQNRRLRALLAGAAVLLVVAMVAGLLAVRQANRADRATVEAEARRVGAQALLADDLDRSLLLAVEGVRLDNSTDTRANLLSALSRSPEPIASTRGDGKGFFSLDLSPDGKVAGVGRAFSGLSFYDTTTREMLGSYDDVTVGSFEFRPDGKELAVSAQLDFDVAFDPNAGPNAGLPASPVRLVDADTWQAAPVQLGGMPQNAWPSEPHYSADGRFLAVSFDVTGDTGPAEHTTSVLVWDLALPQQPIQRVDQSGPPSRAVLSPDGGLMYVGSYVDSPSVFVYDVATGQLLYSASMPGTELAALEVSPNGSLLAAVDGNEIVLLDAATLGEQGRLQGHTDSVRAIKFSHSGALLASGSGDHTAIVWDVTTRQPLQQLSGHAQSVQGVGFSRDDSTLYTAGLDDVLLTWDLIGDRRFVPRLLLAEPSTLAHGAIGSPSGDAVAYAIVAEDEGGTEFAAWLQFLDLGTGRAGPMIDTDHHSYGSQAWRPDGGRLATAGDDGFVRVWNWRTSKLIIERPVAPQHITGLVYTGDGGRLVVVEQSGDTYAIDAETLEPDGTPIQLEGVVQNVLASPDNHTAAVVFADRVALVDLDNGEVIHEADAGAVVPWTGDFSPDGRRFAVGGSFGDVRVLDVETGEWEGPPTRGHTGDIHVVHYAPDGTTFVTGGADSAVVLWDASTTTRLFTLPGPPEEGGRGPTFLPDGHTVLIPSLNSGIVYTWDTRLEHWIEAACAIAGRNFTEAEWNDIFDNRPYRETCPSTTQG
jgi:WD40 repeat protein/DNA-binding SARP family transcriptional activator